MMPYAIQPFFESVPGLSTNGARSGVEALAPVEPTPQGPPDWFALYRQGHNTGGAGFAAWIWTTPEVAMLLTWLLNGGTEARGQPVRTPQRAEWRAVHTSGATADQMALGFPTFPW